MTDTLVTTMPIGSATKHAIAVDERIVVTNREFLQGLFGIYFDRAWVTARRWSDGNNGWGGGPYALRRPLIDEHPELDQYTTVSIFTEDAEGGIARDGAHFVAQHALMVDDIGTKMPMSIRDRLPPPTALVETSPGNYQGWWRLVVPASDTSQLQVVMNALTAMAKDGVDPGHAGVTRYGRLPVGTNSKPNYNGGNGVPVQLAQWHPENEVLLTEFAQALGIVDLQAAAVAAPTLDANQARPAAADVAGEHPVIQAFAAHDMLRRPGPDRNGWWPIICPWESEHSVIDDRTHINIHEGGGWGFKCHHGHCVERKVIHVREVFRERFNVLLPSGSDPSPEGDDASMPHDDPDSWNDPFPCDDPFEAQTPSPGDEASPRPPAPPPSPPVIPRLPAPYPGAMVELVEAMTKNAPRPQPQLGTLAALIAMSCVCGSGYALKRGGARLNLYGVGVVETTGGKDVPHKAARRLVRQAGGVVLDRPGSAAGLEDALVPRRGMLTSVDEAAGMIASINDPHAQGYMKELAGLLLRLFSAGNDTHVCRSLKSDKRNSGEPTPEVENPAVSLLMFSTPETLTKAMTSADATNGFVGRLLFAFGERNVPMAMEFDEFSLSPGIIEHARQIAMVNNRDPGARIGMGHVPDFPVRIKEDAGALDARLVIRDRLHDEGDSDRSDFGASIRGRHLEIMDRIAGTLAVWENFREPVVSAEHVAYADAFMVGSNAAMREIVGAIWDDPKLREAEHVLTLMRKLAAGEIQPPRESHAADLAKQHVPLSAIVLRAKLPGDRLKAALEYLLMADLVRTVQIDRDGRKGALPVLYSLSKD